jgi:hypothetical protein
MPVLLSNPVMMIVIRRERDIKINHCPFLMPRITKGMIEQGPQNSRFSLLKPSVNPFAAYLFIKILNLTANLLRRQNVTQDRCIPGKTCDIIYFRPRAP